WPIIRIKPRARLRLNRLWLQPFTMVIFTSPNGARLFMQALRERGIDARALHGKRVVAMGSGTAQVLSGHGVLPDTIPRRYVAEGILEALPDDLSHETVLVPRAARAREILPERLRRRGASVTVLPVYDTVTITAGDCPVQDGDHVLFTSSSTAEAFFNHPGCRGKKIVPCCMGAITEATVRRYHNGFLSVARNATIPALITALIAAVKRRRSARGKSP
ncbi:MAG: uroporphyrinogen-III synthase, partial [Chitinispirillaceae bacterium]|nr:uroporphyrinogen-III synthase [Chitinispirillaceae bacterium]